MTARLGDRESYQGWEAERCHGGTSSRRDIYLRASTAARVSAWRALLEEVTRRRGEEGLNAQVIACPPGVVDGGNNTADLATRPSRRLASSPVIHFSSAGNWPRSSAFPKLEPANSSANWALQGGSARYSRPACHPTRSGFVQAGRASACFSSSHRPADGKLRAACCSRPPSPPDIMGCWAMRRVRAVSGDTWLTPSAQARSSSRSSRPRGA